ncbi:MAG: very short patch repair endonuclease [Patescibacteria group bacterium]|nr:very short patch repair endonuclease [Patescibacteria group bacterium]MDE2437973.1 very short patch repair endonuclease [Patescibacteria group bacterium]
MKKPTNNYLGRNFKKTKTRDKLSKEKRSVLMSKIRSEHTDFEKRFFSLLRKSLGVKFETHQRDIKGKPDVVFGKKKLCVFLDSDFWHGWQYPRWKHLLKNEFWRNKIESNRTRDRRTTQYLRSNGWEVLRIWGHLVQKNPQGALNKIKMKLMSIG